MPRVYAPANGRREKCYSEQNASFMRLDEPIKLFVSIFAASSENITKTKR